MDRTRRIVGIGAALLTIAVGVVGCSGSSSSKDGSGSASVSWTNGTSKKAPTFAGMGIGSDYASLVIASFKPSNDVVLLNPKNEDFRVGDWLFSGTIEITNGELKPGTYTGPTLKRSYLYYYDSERKQTYNQYLDDKNATIVISSVSGDKANGTVTVSDTANGYSITTSFSATTRKL